MEKNFKCTLCHHLDYSTRVVCPSCKGIDSHIELLPCVDPKPLPEHAEGSSLGEWNKMEKAPKGGGAELVNDPKWVSPPKILLKFESGDISVGYWDWCFADGGRECTNGIAWIEPISGEQLSNYYDHPVGWMPLPAPPTPTQSITVERLKLYEINSELLGSCTGELKELQAENKRLAGEVERFGGCLVAIKIELENRGRVTESALDKVLVEWIDKTLKAKV